MRHWRGQKKTGHYARSQKKGKMKWNIPGVRHDDTLPFNCFIFAPVNMGIIKTWGSCPLKKSLSDGSTS